MNDAPPTPQLIPFPVNRDDITPYYEALAAALDGKGPALLPYAESNLAPDCASGTGASTEALPDGLALVVSTSGSTGTPKRAMLTRDALLASALATHARLGGPGTWLLPLPPHHIAGTQVIVRSIVAGTTPIALPEWSLTAFTKATTLVARNAPPFSPIYTSLVPTQLSDVLTDDRAIAAARRYRAILVGGAASSPDLLERARDAGLRIVTTYGSSETAGGCVYDRLPLDGVEAHVLEPGTLTPLGAGSVGQLALTGPTLASGYLGDPERSAATFITISTVSNPAPSAGDQEPTRAYLTDDLGSIDADDGTLHVLGRIDEAVNTGGYKVLPRIVEDAVASAPGVAQALVTGLPDERWGQIVAVAVVAQAPEASADPLGAEILDVCRRALPPYAVPRQIAVLDALPTRGIGKPNRAALADLTTWQALR